MPHRIIRRIRTARRKRDADACDDPQETSSEAICLLELFSPGSGVMQRRAIEVSLDGERVWLEFEIVTSFESVEAALTYAHEHGIEHVDI